MLGQGPSKSVLAAGMLFPSHIQAANLEYPSSFLGHIMLLWHHALAQALYLAYHNSPRRAIHQVLDLST